MAAQRGGKTMCEQAGIFNHILNIDTVAEWTVPDIFHSLLINGAIIFSFILVRKQHKEATSISPQLSITTHTD